MEVGRKNKKINFKKSTLAFDVNVYEKGGPNLVRQNFGDN